MKYTKDTTQKPHLRNQEEEKEYEASDKVVEDLKKEFDVRSCVGFAKYGTTLEDNDTDDFLQHLKEELMDASLYIQKLQNIIKLNNQ